MAVADFLEKIGEGVTKGAKAVGSVALPIAERTAQVVSGQAPQIDEEKRQQQYKLEDAQLAAKEQELTAQLATGRKYGTLTPEQQSQYVDQISQIYSHPRHAGTLMEKLRQAIHPNGAVATPYQSLPNATPKGGTAQADEENAEKLAEARSDAARRNNPKLSALDNFTQQKYGTDYASSTPEQQEESLQAYVRASTKGSVGKSPPLSGNMLPPDAVGPDGQPIGPAGRDAAHSFVEYNGSWWPVAKPKPVLKTIQGHVVLVDPQSGAKLRDLGASGTERVTTRQTLQPGDDGQMHLVTLTSVTAPGGEKIEVDPEQSEEPQPGGESKPPTSASPAKKPSVGGILPKVNPVTAPPGGSSGRVVPGLSTLAKSKNPLFKSDVAQYTKVAEDANSKREAYDSARKALASGSTASSDQELIYSWVRANVQGAGRMTQAEFKQAASTGSLPLRAQGAFEKLKSGKLPPELEQMLLADIKRSAETSQAEAEDLRKRVDNPAGAPTPGWAAPHDAPPAPSTDGKVLKANGQVIAKSQGGRWVQP